VFDNYGADAVVDGAPVSLGLWDTDPHEDFFDSLRRRDYLKSHVFLVCFSVTSPSSLENVVAKWIPEIRHHMEANRDYHVPIIIVGTKSDLRHDEGANQTLQQEGRELVDPRRAQEIAHALGAMKYLECSALTQIGLKNVFDEAIREALRAPPKKPGCIDDLCVIL